MQLSVDREGSLAKTREGGRDSQYSGSPDTGCTPPTPPFHVTHTFVYEIHTPEPLLVGCGRVGKRAWFAPSEKGQRRLCPFSLPASRRVPGPVAGLRCTPVCSTYLSSQVFKSSSANFGRGFGSPIDDHVIATPSSSAVNLPLLPRLQVRSVIAAACTKN
eukprot:COSAG06_NODE_8318_length_2204_cov_3.265907_1_plen_160_part_00